MKNLIIVGNGFDLAHGLKTSYYDFRLDLTNNISEYDVGNLDTNYLLKSFLNNENELWSDIESAYFDILVNLHDNTYLQTNYLFPSQEYRNSKELNDDFEVVKKCLTIYLLKQEKEFEIDSSYQNFFNRFKNEDAVVLNFNYTNTVEQYVDGKDIELIHIHGELENENNPIIFGFAANEKQSKQLLIENDNNYVRNIKKFNYLFTENEERLKKYLKESHEYNVFILGHSCGISDSLILSQIFNSKNVYEIIPFYYKDIDGYFDIMVNIDRIIDDYSKTNEEAKVFNKLLSFPNCQKMPQKDDNINLERYLFPLLNRIKTSHQYRL